MTQEDVNWPYVSIYFKRMKWNRFKLLWQFIFLWKPYYLKIKFKKSRYLFDNPSGFVYNNYKFKTSDLKTYPYELLGFY